MSGSHHSKSRLTGSSSPLNELENVVRPPQAPSNQTRQNRLQQLTTQLLWRLQQSSPYHSSSRASLVLPLLPEATPRLEGLIKSSRLLPGLEESQGALYEIGVSDDGTFVGLTEDEMEESLTNLRSMAASLGCKVEVLRRVVVGDCEWTEDTRYLENGSVRVHAEMLWVVEALVSPDLDSWTHRLNSKDLNAQELVDPIRTPLEMPKVDLADSGQSPTAQLRISLTGATTSGKSSLLGTLSTSTFDNGRGKSRLSLLRHRHEIASGVTSSVAQELIGYNCLISSENATSPLTSVVNYAADNVSSWTDIIHEASDMGRLVFMSDSAGHPRFSKTTARSLISWAPHWTLLCVAADDSEGINDQSGSTTTTQALSPPYSDVDLSLSHLELCIKLRLPLAIAITKLDVASRTGLRQTLTKMLSALKTAGRRPLMLSTTLDMTDQLVDLQHISLADEHEVANTITTVSTDFDHVVPIVLTSAVTGAGIGKIHALLRSLPIPTKSPPIYRLSNSLTNRNGVPSKLFHVDEVFAMPPTKVYSPGSQVIGMSGTGVVLCGHVTRGTISIGDELLIGPVTFDLNLDDRISQSIHRSSSFPNQEIHTATPSSAPGKLRARPRSGEFSMARSRGLLSNKTVVADSYCTWQQVRVISVRNLRLPVQKLFEDQVGTIGVESMTASNTGTPPVGLGRIRKGMILASSDNNTCPPPSYTGFIATFPKSDFSSSSSPPLILGGHAIVYIASIRAAAKVTCVALAPKDESTASSSPQSDVFAFDDEYDGDPIDSEPEDIKITFSFVSAKEWIELGTQVLVMPASGTGGGAAGAGVVGLEGFVGRICDGIVGGEGKYKGAY